MKIIHKIIQPIILPHWWQDLLLIIPRIICGYLLAFNFGSAKFGMPWSPLDNNLGLFEVAFWFPNDVAEYGGIFSVFSAFFAWMGAFSEAVGSLFLLFGFQTRIASFLIVATMLVAIFLQHAGKDLWMQLPAMGFLWIAMFYLILGSGRFGLDYLVTRKLVTI